MMSVVGSEMEIYGTLSEIIHQILKAGSFS